MPPLTKLLLALTATLLQVTVGHAQAPARPVTVVLANDTPLERRGREQLQRILSTWSLDAWMFTRAIRIESGAIPHSHPTLTINTQYVENDTAQIATFVHEQLHWYFDAKQSATDSAIARLATMFPDAPAGPPEGAMNRQSTYLHLLVCLSEFNAVKQLFNESVARRTLQSWKHYSWVYREVLQRPAPIQQVLREFGLESPDSRK